MKLPYCAVIFTAIKTNATEGYEEVAICIKKKRLIAEPLII